MFHAKINHQRVKVPHRSSRSWVSTGNIAENLDINKPAVAVQRDNEQTDSVDRLVITREKEREAENISLTESCKCGSAGRMQLHFPTHTRKDQVFEFVGTIKSRVYILSLRAAVVKEVKAQWIAYM